MKRFFSFDREEKGLPLQGNAYPPQPTTAPRVTDAEERERISQLYHAQNINLVPANNKLLIFRSLTGIDHVPVLSKDGFFQPRNVPNVGIYTRVVEAERLSALRYRAFSILINTCLAVQIVVAAALTAIGAAQGPHGVITAFGAINTIMAGILTYLRGAGLPNREKNIEKAWGQVREYIEQREREFCLEGCMLNVEDEIRTVERMYEEVRLQMEAGSSESGGSRGIGMGNVRDLRPRTSMLSGLDTAKTAAAAEQEHLEGGLHGRMDQFGDQYRQTSENVRHTGQSRMDQLKDGLRQVSEHFQHTGEQARDTGESRIGHIRDELRHVGDYFRHTGESIQHTGENIQHTGADLRSTSEQVRQTGQDLRSPELHVSIQTQMNSKQTQTDSPVQRTEKDFE